MDDAITHWMNAGAGAYSIFDAVMIALSAYGIPLLVLGVTSQWFCVKDRLHLRHTACAAGFAFLLGLGFNQFVLLFIHRARPYVSGLTHLLVSPSKDWSFPSDHATAGVAIATTFALHALPRRAVAMGATALLIAFSRVFVGTHYFSDVLGGAATGICAAVLVRVIYIEGSTVDRRLTAIF